MKWLLLIGINFSVFTLGAQKFSTATGDVGFISDAPLEKIEARSTQLQGLLDVSDKNFAFKIYIKTFDGFNNQLQKVHFYENYLETDKYPIAFFKGKILEDLVKGKSLYRAKGILEIHGVQNERIIEVNINLNHKSIQFNSEFTVQLAEHDIDLPRIVYQKVSEEITVIVKGVLNLRE